MRVKLAAKTGFCFGVKRAVGMAEKALKSRGTIYSLGSIIHNAQVVEKLARKGLKIIRNARDIRSGTIVISSHGISPRIAKDIKNRGIRIVDTTCPFVLNAQRIARRLSREGYTVVIVGDAAHPEIKALVDFVSSETFVVKNRREAARLSLSRSARVSVISQTTQSAENFLGVVSEIAKKGPRELRVFSTICRDAGDRQDEARSLAKTVDVMFVVGGRNSANTKRLFEVCKGVLKNSCLIEKEGELKDSFLKECRRAGITSGASTPDEVVQKIANKIKSYRKGQWN